MVVIRLKPAGVRELLRSPGVMRELQRRANNIAAAAGAGHVVETEIGPKRARAAVITDSFEAMRAEATSRRLTYSIDAGRA